MEYSFSLKFACRFKFPVTVAFVCEDAGSRPFLPSKIRIRIFRWSGDQIHFVSEKMTVVSFNDRSDACTRWRNGKVDLILDVWNGEDRFDPLR